ncbi:MAG: aminopeptidase P family protein [Nitrospirae bacterium]|nr:aminopeptidase P family protein [Nitrospirota bacterium]
MPEPYENRLDRLRHSLKGLDSLIITNINNVRYLTGFTGSSGIAFVTKTHRAFITDFRYKLQAEKEVKGWDILIAKDRMTTLRQIIKKLKLKSLRFEASVSYEFFERLKTAGLRLKPMRAGVERLRAQKDSSEVISIKEAVRRAEQAFLEVMPYIKAGVREKEIALKLEERLKKNGCNRIPFDIIVASGENSSMPHAKVTERKLKAGDLVIIDWGGESHGYYSDMTRTLLIRGANIGEKIEIYNLVLEANRKGISTVSDGIQASVIDNTVRDVIKKAGYGSSFGHGLGHGVGLEVHEMPHITGRARGRIREGMVFTVEPGIYVSGIGGVRLEDMVLVKKTNAEVLTTLTKELKIIG